MIKFSALLALFTRYSRYVFSRLLLVLLLLPMPMWAAETLVSEAALKAAFVYNFTQFIAWPAAPADTPFRLCVLNAKSEIRELFNRLDGKKANHQVIELVYLPADFSTTALPSCQLIFQPDRVATTLKKPLPKGVVWVAYDPEKNDPNISITMHFNSAKQLRFSINQAATNAAGVKVSSQLLKLAFNKQEAEKP